MGFSSWKGRYRGVVGRGRSPQPGRSCVPPAAFPSRGAGPPLQSGVPVRRELSVQNRPRRTGRAFPSGDRRRPRTGQACLRVLALDPTLRARPSSDAGAGRRPGPAKGQVRGSRSRPGRAPSSGQTACYSAYRPFWYPRRGRALTPRTEGLIAPRALIISSAAKGWLRPRPTLGKLPVCDPSRRSPLSPGSGAQRPGRLPSPRGARPSLLPAAEGRMDAWLAAGKRCLLAPLCAAL